MRINAPKIKHKPIIWNAKVEVCSNCGYEAVQVCLCGMNRVCSKCGYGMAAYPCNCEKEENETNT